MSPEVVTNAQGTWKCLVLPALSCLVSELVCHQSYLAPKLTDIPI